MFRFQDIVVLALLPLAQGWWVFGRDEVKVRAVGDVSAECEELARTGDCGFYSCLERRFPCGRGGYALKYGLKYCNKFLDSSHLFDEEGKEWLAASRTCLMRELLVIYRQNEVTCKDISRQGFSTHSTCFLRHGFCNILWENKRGLVKVVEAKDLFDKIAAHRIWREILDLAKGCAQNNLRRFLAWALQDVKGLPLHG